MTNIDKQIVGRPNKASEAEGRSTTLPTQISPPPPLGSGMSLKGILRLAPTTLSG